MSKKVWITEGVVFTPELNQVEKKGWVEAISEWVGKQFSSGEKEIPRPRRIEGRGPK